MDMIEIYTDDDFCDRVREVLNADSDTVTDTVIERFENRQMAEMEVRNKVPEWETILNGDDEYKSELLKTCVVYQTAVYLSPVAAKSNIKVAQTTHSKVEYFESGTDTLIQSISARLSDFYSILNGGSGEAEITLGFAITNPECIYKGSGFDI